MTVPERVGLLIDLQQTSLDSSLDAMAYCVRLSSEVHFFGSWTTREDPMSAGFLLLVQHCALGGEQCVCPSMD